MADKKDSSRKWADKNQKKRMNVAVYLAKEDEAKKWEIWESIEDKKAFLFNALDDYQNNLN